MPEEAFTPIQEVLNNGKRLFVKRDDLYECAGVRGGKARTCRHLVEEALRSFNPPCELVTAASRQSPQILITASIAKAKGLKCRVFIPRSKGMTPILEQAVSLGAAIERNSAWHYTVIVAHSKAYCENSGEKAFYIPFGMQCHEAVAQTKKQVANIPSDVRRIVVPIGSGMSVSGVLTGLKERGLKIPVLGIQAGMSPVKQLDRYAPSDWPSMLHIIQSHHDYHESVEAFLGDIRLDPVYEAKCLEFLKDGDLFWIVGSRFAMNPSEKELAASNHENDRSDMKAKHDSMENVGVDERAMVSICEDCARKGRLGVSGYKHKAEKLGWFPPCESTSRSPDKCPCHTEFSILALNGRCLRYNDEGSFATWTAPTKLAVAVPKFGYMICKYDEGQAIAIEFKQEKDEEAYFLKKGSVELVPFAKLKRHKDSSAAIAAYLEMLASPMEKGELLLGSDWRKHTPEELTQFKSSELLAYYGETEYRKLLRSLVEGVVCRKDGKESWPLAIVPKKDDPDRRFPYFEVDKETHIKRFNSLAKLWERIDITVKADKKFDVEVDVICEKDGELLKTAETESDDEALGVLTNSWQGMDFASAFHKQMFEVPVDRGMPPIEVFKNPELFEKLYCRAFISGSNKNAKITKNGVRKVFSTANSLKELPKGCRSTKNFQPSAALWLYKYFGMGGKVLDPSAGFSGRLIGALCSKIKGYVGVDPEEAQIKGGEACRDTFLSWYPELKAISVYNGKAPDAKLVQAPFEEASQQDVPDNSFDMAFTSPPYFGFEEYNAENAKQSTSKYPTRESWENEFLPAYVERAYKALKEHGWYLINVANVPGAEDLEGAVRAACKRAFGTDPLFTMGLSLPRPPAAHKSGKTGSKVHPIFVYCKGAPLSYTTKGRQDFIHDFLQMPPGQTVVERPLMADPKN